MRGRGIRTGHDDGGEGTPHSLAMPTFTAELHLTLGSLNDWPLLRSVLGVATERAAIRGELVRYVGGAYLPEAGRLLCLFSAPDANSVRRVLAAGNLRTARIDAAVLLSAIDPPVGPA